MGQQYVTYRFEILALHHIGRDALIAVQPHGDVAHHVLDELRIVVGALGDELLVRALEDAVQLARGFALREFDQLFDPDVSLQPRLDGDVRALVVRASSEIFFEHGHRLVTGTTTLIQVQASPPRISPISDAW